MYAHTLIYIYKEKGYARPYLTDPRKLYQIGVNFSSETGTIQGFVQELGRNKKGANR